MLDVDKRLGCDVESVQKVCGYASGTYCESSDCCVEKKERGCWAMEGFK
jgi:hypothetical protein